MIFSAFLNVSRPADHFVKRIEIREVGAQFLNKGSFTILEFEILDIGYDRCQLCALCHLGVEKIRSIPDN